MLWPPLKLWQKQCFYYNFFNHEEEDKSNTISLQWFRFVEASPIFSPLTVVELVHKGTDEHSVQNQLYDPEKKNKWTNLYPTSNQNWMLSRVLKHLENLFNIVPSFGSIFSLISIQDGRGKKGWNVMRKLYSAEVYVRRTNAFSYLTSIPMSHT